jgi:hypothetical protein
LIFDLNLIWNVCKDLSALNSSERAPSDNETAEHNTPNSSSVCQMEKGGASPRGNSFLGHGWLKSAHYTDADSDADAHVGNQMMSEVSFVGAIGEPGLTTPLWDKGKEMCRKDGQGTRPRRSFNDRIQNPLAPHSLDTGFEQYADVSSMMLLHGTTAMSLYVTPRLMDLGLSDNVQNQSLPKPVPHSEKEKVQRSAPICALAQLGAPGRPTRHYFEDLIPTMTTESLGAQSKGPQDCDNVQNHVEPSLPMTEEVPYSAAWIQRSYSTLVLTFRFGFGCVTRVCTFASPSESCACLLFLALSRVPIS